MRPTNLWWSRGNPDGNNGCPEFPREGAPTNAPNYGATPTELCPYVINEGLTVMNGPVYRYDEDATDDSRRWPDYWDGRWFLHNSGGPSVKHGLLLDPATDQDGGRPIYADSLRDALDWDAAYMDSKFGPDGALYVQVYDGFFRAGPDAGIWRYDYVGGPATPGSAPRAFAIGDREVAFEKGASGGVSYAWAFDDGATSTEPDPTHQFATAGSHSAELTVTYADGSTDTATVTVDVIAEVDETAPVTTASTTPADPNGTRPVTVTLSATDAGTGVARTEYRINGGAWQEYSAPFRRSEPGEYVVDYRSIDRANNTEDPAKQLTFTISVIQNCTPDLNDEFDGTDAERRLGRAEPATTAALSVADGELALEIRAGDLFGGPGDGEERAPQGRAGRPVRRDDAARRRAGSPQSGPAGGPRAVERGRPEHVREDRLHQQGRRGPPLRVRGDARGRGRHPGRPVPGRRAARGVHPRAGRRRRPLHPRVLGGRRGRGSRSPSRSRISATRTRCGSGSSSPPARTPTTAARFLYFRVDCSDRIAPTSDGDGQPGAAGRRARLVPDAADGSP